MEEKKFKAVKHTIPTTITGSSTINHKIRMKLGISCDEYVVLDFLKTLQDKNSDERITYEKLYTRTGFTEGTLPAIWKSLKEKELVYKDEKTAIVKPAEKWNQYFASTDGFEDLWKGYGILDGKEIGNRGNKAKAKEMYIKAIKVVEPQILLDSALAYTFQCNKTGTFIKNCSSWLNPKYKYWEDTIVDLSAEKETAPALKDFMHGTKT